MPTASTIAAKAYTTVDRVSCFMLHKRCPCRADRLHTGQEKKGSRGTNAELPKPCVLSVLLLPIMESGVETLAALAVGRLSGMEGEEEGKV